MTCCSTRLMVRFLLPRDSHWLRSSQVPRVSVWLLKPLDLTVSLSEDGGPVAPSGKVPYSSFSAEHNRNPHCSFPKCAHRPGDGVSPFIPLPACGGLLARFSTTSYH